MDQLKTQLAAIKQHSFWAMCLGILGVSVGSWWVSTGKLQTEQAAQTGKIKGSFDSLKTISSEAEHPNEGVLKGMDDLNRQYANEVLKGWQLQYDQQAGVLVWPKGFEQSGFKAYVDKLRPIEKIPVANGMVSIKDDLPRDYKEEYRNFIEDELPKLAEIIRARWQVSTQGTDPNAPGAGLAGGLGGAAGFGAPATGLDASGNPVLVDDSVVLWDPANQQEILMTHFGFCAGTSLPTTLQVLYAQEDYWVFDNIMQIIRAANKVYDAKGQPIDSTARHEAVVKRIDFVRIGRSAIGLAGMVTPVGRAGMGAGGESGGYGTEGGAMPASSETGSADGGAGAMPMPGGGTGDGVMGPDMTLLRDPAFYRYVDDKYAPLDPTRLRGALKSTTPEDALLAVAKRMPVRIRVAIDQRKLNVLLAECGNSKLPVEVRQVRINRAPAAGGAGMGGGYGGGMMAGGGEGAMPMPGSMSGGGFGGGFGGGGFGGTGSADGGYGGGGGFGAFGGGGTFGGGAGAMPMPGTFGGSAGGYSGEGGYSGGMPGMPGMGSGKMGMQVGSVTQDANVDPNMIDVELYGIVYIYNPANMDQLAAPAAPPADGAPPADPSAAPPQPAEGVPLETPAEVTPPAETTATTTTEGN